MTTRADFHADTAEAFLAKARAYLADGDLLQASEKAWGAAAQTVKAAAEQRGWRHQSHGDLFQIVKRLADESTDSSPHALFHSAKALHQNFYEGLMTEDSVAVGLQQVDEFVRRLDQRPN